jgi:N-sulfoglucosamine sulfohydrolase
VKKHDPYIFASHTGDGTMNQFPQRCIRDPRWKLVFNLQPENKWTTHFTKVMDIPDSHGDVYATWIERAQSDAAVRKLVETIERHPSWELYDTETDPYELNNLISQDGQTGRVRVLRSRLVAWLKEQGDQATLSLMDRQKTGNP